MKLKNQKTNSTHLLCRNATNLLRLGNNAGDKKDTAQSKRDAEQW